MENNEILSTAALFGPPAIVTQSRHPARPGGPSFESKDDSRQLNIVGTVHKVENNLVLSGDSNAWTGGRELAWLAPSKEVLAFQAQIYRNSIEALQPGTGEWFIEGSALAQWVEGHSQMMWLRGRVGSGKTILFSNCIGKLRRMESLDLICPFFCSTGSDHTLDLHNLLRSWLVQLCSPDSLPSAVIELYQACHRQFPASTPTIEALSNTLLNVLSFDTGKKIYLLCDGLDEVCFEDRGDFLDLFRSLSKLSTASKRLLVASRNQDDIRQELEGTLKWECVELIDACVEADIAQYVTSQIDNHRYMSKFSAVHKDLVRKKLIVQGDGMFLCTALQMRSLKRIRVSHPDRYLDRISKFPETLDDIYLEILRQIDEYYVSIARLCFTWLTLSSRPLYIEELIEASTIDLTAPSLLSGSKMEWDVFDQLLNDLIMVTPPVKASEAVTEKKHIVTLTHASVGEFLMSSKLKDHGSGLSRFFIDHSIGHRLVGQSCLAYLYLFNSKNLTPNDESDSEVTYSVAVRSRSLLSYAYFQWQYHFPENDAARGGSMNADSRARARKLYKDMSPLWVGQWVRDLERLKRAMDEPLFQPLFRNMGAEYWSQPLLTYSAGSGKSSKAWAERNRFRYIPLAKTKSFRLLHVLPGLDSKTAIKCSLVTTNMDEMPRYEVISYIWGDPGPQHRILLHGTSIYVTTSLFHILVDLRARAIENSFPIWVDAISINQKDMLERNSQVAILPEIYSRAQRGLVCLPAIAQFEEYGYSALLSLSNVIKNFAESYDDTKRSLYADQVASITTHRGWEPAIAMLSVPWWRRTWIVQEVLLPPNTSIAVGSLLFSFTIVENLVFDWAAKSYKLCELCAPLETLFCGDYWPYVEQLAVISRRFRSRTSFSFPQLVWHLRSREVTDPRDILYSLLGLVSGVDDAAERPMDVTPDYSRARDDVFLDFSEQIIATYKNLDILSIRSSYRPREGNEVFWDTYETCRRVRSWVLQLDLTQNCDPLHVGIFALERTGRMFCAGGNSLCSQNFSLCESDLEIRGATIGKIDRIHHPVLDEDNSTTDNAKLKEFCIGRYLQWHCAISVRETPHRYKNPVLTYWRTMLADQWPPGSRLPQAKHQESNLSLDTEQAHKSSDLPSIFTQRELFFKYIDDTLPPIPSLRIKLDFLRHRELFITLDGYIGLGPERMKPGDDIVFVKGAPVPYVVRQVVRQDDWGYDFIGECYIDGLMDGELLSQEKDWSQTFQLI